MRGEGRQGGLEGVVHEGQRRERMKRFRGDGYRQRKEVAGAQEVGVCGVELRGGWTEGEGVSLPFSIGMWMWMGLALPVIPDCMVGWRLIASLGVEWVGTSMIWEGLLLIRPVNSWQI